MLGLVTLIGMAAIMLTTSHLRLVGNLQSAVESEMAARSAIEFLVSCPNFHKYRSIPNQCLTINGRILRVSLYSIRDDGSSVQQASCAGDLQLGGGGSITSKMPRHSIFEVSAGTTQGGPIFTFGILTPFSKCSEIGTSDDPCPDFPNPNPCN